MSAPTRRGADAPQQQSDSPHSTPSTRQGHRGSRATKYGLALRIPSLGRFVGVESTVAVAAVLALATGLPPSVLYGIAVPVAVVPFLVVAGRSVPDWIATSARFATRSVPSVGITTDHTEDDGRTFGVHWRGDRVSCVLELRPAREEPTRLGRATAIATTSLDLAVLAQSLRQHDLAVHSIDIVSHGSRSASGSPATEVYEHLIGPLPAVATRTVWVTVTLEVSANRAGVDARGGGRAGASRAAGIATERISRSLSASGIASRMLTRVEIQSAASHLCRGVPTDRLTENWRSAPLPGVIDTGYGFDCRRVDDEVLADLWAVPSLSTTVVLRLTPDSRADHVRVSGACRFVTRGARPRPNVPGPVSMNGRHREALLASLPLAIEARGNSGTARALACSPLRALHVPVGGCGQLLGSDASGHGVAARVHGRHLRTVLIAGELYLAQQLVFRAVATGARVLVRTDRPHAWGPLVDSMAAPDRVQVDGGPHRSAARFDMLVQDFADAVAEAPRSRDDGTTVVTLTEHPPRTPMPDPDLSIVQPGAAGDRILVRIGGTEAELVLVTISQETAFIGRPRSVRAPSGAGRPG